MRGRGNHSVRGRGGGAKADRSSSHPRKASRAPLEPVFPVVTPAPSSSRAAAPLSAVVRHGAERPPEAISARRAPPSSAASGFVPPAAPRAFQRGGARGRGRGRAAAGEGAPPTPRGRGGDGFRGGAGRGGGLARGRGGAATAPAQHRYGKRSRAEEDDGEEEKERNTAATPGRRGVPQPHLDQVITTVTEDGTEIPKKLNNKVFIDGLPYNYQPEPGRPSLEEEVLQFVSTWKVGKALRLIKKPGQGFGFVVFKSPHSVTTAVRVLHGRKFLGRALRVEEPKLKDLEKMEEIGELKDVGKSSFQRQVLLSDLSKISQPEMLRELLRDLAPQLETKMEMIKMTAKNRKAFLTFEAESDADSAVQFLDGLMLLGRRVTAAKAAAPGTLPYSKHSVTPLPDRVTGGVNSALHGMGGSSPDAEKKKKEEEEEEDLIMPLGYQPNPRQPLAPSVAATTRTKRATTSAAAMTGKTSQYDLLDKGADEIYVGNLGEDITDHQLHQHFASCGAIRECQLVVNPATHVPTGIARIRFALPAYAAYAQEHLHGSRLMGHTLRVDRGDAASPSLPAEHVEDDGEEVYDESAVLRRYGVKDKKAFFKGTSLEEEEAEDVPRQAKTKGRKASQTTTRKGRSGKDEEAEEEDDDDVPFPFLDDDDDDEEEHFYDVDPATTSKASEKKKMTSKKVVGGGVSTKSKKVSTKSKKVSAKKLG